MSSSYPNGQKNQRLVPEEPVPVGMWRTRLWMVAQGFLLVSFLGAMGLGIQLFLNPLVFPVSEVHVVGQLRHLDKARLQSEMLPHFAPGFFGFSIRGLQKQLQAEPWVERVEARREWRGRVIVEITEHRPRALWGARGVISTHGDLFYPESVNGLEGLPIMEGPEGRSALVWQNFLAMEKVLAPFELHIQSIQLAPRGAWEISLDNNIRVVLGTQDVLTRLRRFTRAYDKLLGQQRESIAYVDLRYTSGMAVGWKRAFG